MLGVFGTLAFVGVEQTDRANILRIVMGGTLLVFAVLLALIMAAQPAAILRSTCAVAGISTNGIILLYLNRGGQTR